MNYFATFVAKRCSKIEQAKVADHGKSGRIRLARQVHLVSAMYATHTNTKGPDMKIEIFADDVWAGEGRLVDGVIVDCPAVLGGSQDTSDEIYELIQDTIEEGDDLEVDYEGVTYSWFLED
jgi:hypothetical protein